MASAQTYVRVSSGTCETAGYKDITGSTECANANNGAGTWSDNWDNIIQGLTGSAYPTGCISSGTNDSDYRNLNQDINSHACGYSGYDCICITCPSGQTLVNGVCTQPAPTPTYCTLSNMTALSECTTGEITATEYVCKSMDMNDAVDHTALQALCPDGWMAEGVGTDPKCTLKKEDLGTDTSTICASATGNFCSGTHEPVDGVCGHPPPPVVTGCTTQTACNYDHTATQDDGSCLVPVGCQSCSTDGTGTIVDNDSDNDGVCLLVPGYKYVRGGICANGLDNERNYSLGILTYSGNNGDNPGSDNDVKRNRCARACKYEKTAISYGPWSADDPATGFSIDVGQGGRCYCNHLKHGDFSTCDPTSMTYDMYRFDAAEVTGCQDLSRCDYNSAATDAGTCLPALDGVCESCSGATDGTGTIVDNDADNDGVCDAADEFPNDATESADADGDTFGDNLADQCPDDINKQAPGDCGCGNVPTADFWCASGNQTKHPKCGAGLGVPAHLVGKLPTDQDFECVECNGSAPDHEFSMGDPDYSGCADHTLCPAGQEPKDKDGFSDPGCKTCGSEFFTTDTNYAPCTGKKTCSDSEYQVSAGNTTTNRVCETKVCTCTGGSPVLALTCSANDAEQCDTCNTGFVKLGDQCLVDTDSDGTADVDDDDDDNDGVLDGDDAFPLNTSKACKSVPETGGTAFAKGETKVLVCSGSYVGGGEAKCTGGEVVKSWQCTLKSDLSDPTKKAEAIGKIKGGIMKPVKGTYVTPAAKETARKGAKAARRSQMKAAVEAGLDWKDLVVEDTNFEGFTDKVILALGTGKAKYRTVFGASQTFEITPGSVLGSVPSGDLDFFDLDDGASITLSVTDETHTVFAEKSNETLTVKCNDVDITGTDEFVCGGRKWYISSLASGTGCVPNAALNVDGVCACVSGYAGSPFDTPTQCLVDTDGDLTADVEDFDDDNDGVLDASDAFPLDSNESVDTDGDGTGDNADTDDDNDGVLDGDDAFPLDSNESVDTDGDGTGNNADTDDDGDGVLDGDDAFPLDSNESVDTDGDGTGDNADFDDDNDGVTDVKEADGSIIEKDCTLEVDCDGDGVNDDTDAFPLDSTETVDTDGDEIGNNADDDDDNDGVTDVREIADVTKPLDATDFNECSRLEEAGVAQAYIDGQCCKC